MEVKFGAGETSAQQTEVVPPTPATATQAVAPVQSALPAKRSFVLGDILPSFDQIILPRVNLAQNIGDLKDSFDPGTIVLAKQTALWLPGNPKTPATTPVVMTALGFRPTRFTEKTTGGARGITVNKESDVPVAGGTLDYEEWNLKKASGMKLFQPLVDVAVLVQRPESIIKVDGEDVPLCPDDDSTFVHEIEGKKYALALWALKGTLYTSLAKAVWFTARSQGCLRGGYPTWSYNISVKEKTFGNGNKSWVPVGIPHSKNTPGFLEFVRAILEPPQQ